MRYGLFILFLLSGVTGLTQSWSQYEWSRYDTLLGSNSSYRNWFDVTDYHLNIKLNPQQQTISGSNTIFYSVIDSGDTMQIDLSARLRVDSIIYQGKSVNFWRDSDFVFVKSFRSPMLEHDSITIYYHGQPMEAEDPPWDGGVVWEKDENGEHWIGVTCEMEGSRIWWPNKDLLSDEPDSARICVTVPSDLEAIANGDLLYQQVVQEGWIEYCWQVQHPINNYNVTFYAGDYDKFQLPYARSEMDTIPLDFYVLDHHEDTAQKHFRQVREILHTFEKYFGPYPFPKDGYALVQAPYLGMEHQTAIAYGNHFKNNLSPTEVMGVRGDLHLPYDFVIIHETAHEWWGNSLTTHDMAELWLHEAFATYAESIFVEEQFGYDTALIYLQYQKKLISHNNPLLGDRGVRFTQWRSVNDLYYKGTWILHTLRNAINNDSLWFSMLKRFAIDNQRSIITTRQWIRFVNRQTDRRWNRFFKQYLRHKTLPILKYQFRQKKGQWQFRYRWEADISRFQMPVKVSFDGGETYEVLHPRSGRWEKQSITQSQKENFQIPKHLFLIQTKEI